MTTTLRPYQLDARYQCNTLLNASRNPVYVAPTGTGKTRTAIAIIADRIRLRMNQPPPNRIYVLTPQDEIFQQWVRAAIEAGLDPGTIADGGITGRARMLYIVMPLTLANLLPVLPESIYPAEIITDECHHSAADTWESIYSRFPRATRLGLTATPRRTDGKPLSHLYTDIVQTITMREAIEAEPSPYLARPLCVVPKQYLDTLGAPDPDSRAGLEEQAARLGKTQIIGDVIENYSLTFGGLPVLVACSTFDHAQDMTERFREAGWRFDHIHSGLPMQERRRMLRDIQGRKLNGLCTVGIGIEGMDIPGLYGLIWLRRTMSLTIYLQFIGRVLRPMEGKKYGIILDPVGNLFIHGWPEMDREWSLEGSGDEKENMSDPALTMQICPFCGVANSADNQFCHFCGKPLRDADGNRPKTCGYCKHTIMIDGEPDCKLGGFDVMYLLFNGCQLFEKRGRCLPAMVDGELIAVESDGQREEIRERAERIKAEQAEADRAREKKREAAGKAIELAAGGKAAILKRGLFAEKRPVFREAVKNYL